MQQPLAAGLRSKLPELCEVTNDGESYAVAAKLLASGRAATGFSQSEKSNKKNRAFQNGSQAKRFEKVFSAGQADGSKGFVWEGSGRYGLEGLRGGSRMATEKKEMIGLIRKMAETTAAVEWYRLRNNELRGALASISLPSAQTEKTGGGRQGGHSDPVGMTAIRREEMEEEIRRNMARIEERLAHHARLSALMGEALDQDERAILWAR